MAKRRRNRRSRPVCPCGGGELASCCGPFLSGAAEPATAEQLMRSRYTAYVLDDREYVHATWHPDTRPPSVELPERPRWLGLEVADVQRGGALDSQGIVEFIARYEGGALHERSRFVRRSGRWVYEGEEPAAEPWPPSRPARP